MSRFASLMLLVACTRAPTLTARVVEARGEVLVNGDPVGEEVRDGDDIEVRQGRLELEAEGIGHLRVFSSTKLSLEPLREHTFTIQLATGRLWSIVTKLNGGARFEVHTPTAIAGVRGTEFVVEASDEESEVRVASGEVEVAGKHQPEGKQRVRAGEKRRMKKRAPPGEVEHYDHSRDRAHWDDLRQAFKQIGEGFKQGGRAVRDGGRSVGRKIRDLFR